MLTPKIPRQLSISIQACCGIAWSTYISGLMWKDFHFEHPSQHWQSGCQKKLCFSANHFQAPRTSSEAASVSFSSGWEPALDPLYLLLRTSGTVLKSPHVLFAKDFRNDHSLQLLCLFWLAQGPSPGISWLHLLMATAKNLPYSWPKPGQSSSKLFLVPPHVQENKRMW